MRKYLQTATFLAVLFYAFNSSLFSQTATSPTLVKVEGGLVEGTIEDGITIYRGIPFAAPPVGDLRWRPPQPLKKWEGVLKGNKFAPACPQANIPMLGYINYGMSEDCLYLNIWKPLNPSDKKLPVIVWIHGGGFLLGSSSQSVTTGEQFAKKGVILVSIAYRLGPLGFLSLPELTSESKDQTSGNYGLLDQIAALRWVQNNIQAFGGDPSCVTIFGQSAGGFSVSMLAASPKAKGLFHRAIAMSGASFSPASKKKEIDCMQILKGAELYGLEFEKRIGANSLAELRKIDFQKLLNDSVAKTGGFSPIIDGNLIIDDQYKLYEAGAYNDIPVLLGTASDEGSIFVMTYKMGDYLNSTRQRFGPFTDKILSIYPDGTDSIKRRSWANLFRDTYFAWNSFAWATLQTKTGKSPVYMYYFDQPQPSSPLSMILKSNKAYHGSDCFYVFNHLDQDSKMKYTAEDKQLSETMINYWINFAKYGDPNGKDLPKWPVYNVNNPIVMYLNGNPHTNPLPNLDNLKVIDEFYNWKRSLAVESK
jgi:para-nitrobenzyl esterase